MSRLKILFLCTGVGIYNRGIETFFRDSFDGLRGREELDVKLYKGAGEKAADEQVLWNLPRTGSTAKLIGSCIRRDGYVVEQLSAFPSAVRAIRKERPAVIFYSDSNLGFQLFRWRHKIGVPYRLLFSNGGPCFAPFNRTDFVHQVTPSNFEDAMIAGEPREKHFMIPYGIGLPDVPCLDENTQKMLRTRLGLPIDRPVVLSVGWISRQHKRMHCVIEEVARLPQPRPFLQLLGAMDSESAEIVEMGNRMLGAQNFSARSVDPHGVADYYRAADVFTLASLLEGFGRVFLEALMHGLPVIAHRHPVMEYVLGEEGHFGKLDSPGVLSALLAEALREKKTNEAMRRRWQHVNDRFSWRALAPQYVEMFQECAARPYAKPF